MDDLQSPSNWPADLTEAEHDQWATELRHQQRQKRREGIDGDGIDAAGLDLTLILGDADDEAADRVLNATVNALNHLQTEIAEETAEPWPSQAGRGYSGGLPEAGGEIVGDEVRLWFASAEGRAVTLEPIALSKVLRNQAEPLR